MEELVSLVIAACLTDWLDRFGTIVLLGFIFGFDAGAVRSRTSVQEDDLEYHLRYFVIVLLFEDAVHSAKIIERHNMPRLLLLVVSILNLICIILLLERSWEHRVNLRSDEIRHMYTKYLMLELLVAYRLNNWKNKSNFKMRKMARKAWGDKRFKRKDESVDLLSN